MKCKHCGRSIQYSTLSGFEHTNGWIVCRNDANTTAEKE